MYKDSFVVDRLSVVTFEASFLYECVARSTDGANPSTARDGAHYILCRCVCVQGERHDVRDDTADYESPSDEGESVKRDKVLKLGTTKSRLFIDCARPSDAGIYTCVAETPTMRIVTTTVLEVGE